MPSLSTGSAAGSKMEDTCSQLDYSKHALLVNQPQVQQFESLNIRLRKRTALEMARVAACPQ